MVSIHVIDLCTFCELKFLYYKSPKVTKFLNQSHAGHRPADTWFLEIVSTLVLDSELSTCYICCSYIITEIVTHM